ncbi:type IV secretion system protein virB4 [Striga asiatica]|uniref:Type IV secretion system protein virB4 n=1 Tax=Striga asiatica TaxID=4170 RepID=A0A5A7QZ72_STRAF|nr:type IV secretion system protein virB4 [Striga asiatica]
MAKALMAFAAILFVLTAQLPLALTFSTGPAFLWSPNLNGKKGMVDYRVLSPRDMVKSALTDGGLREYLCSGEEVQHSKNFAFLFVGSQLQSLDISRPSNNNPALIDLLKDSFSNSNLSLAFPYIAAGEENVAVESSLISELAETCQHEFGIGSIALVGACTVEGENFDKLDHIDSVHDYLNSRIEKSDGHRDLIVLCPGGSEDSDQPHSESNVLSQLLNTVSQLDAKYSVLYISDPFRSASHFSHQGLERFLAEGSLGNASANSTTCDGVCQIKSSLLEGILVGIVLLVILISGLCCMMGIDTPTRFETPQDS